jgi:hypothetical protein
LRLVGRVENIMIIEDGDNQVNHCYYVRCLKYGSDCF